MNDAVKLTKSKALHLLHTVEDEIIDNDKLQYNWIIRNESSLVEEYVYDRLQEMKNEEFDKIMSTYGKSIEVTS